MISTINIEINSVDNIYPDVPKLKQFEFGKDILSINFKKSDSPFIPVDYKSYLRILRADGVFNEVEINLSGSTFDYIIQPFDTFSAGSLTLQFSFLKFDSSNNVIERISSPAIVLDVVNSISSYNIADVKNLDLLTQLIEEVKKLQSTVTYKEYVDKLNANTSKLAGIESGAQVNKLECVSVDGAVLSVDGKKVNIDLSGKVNAVPGMGLSHNDFTDELKNLLDSNTEKLRGIENGAQSNKIESVSVDGVDVPAVGKNVNIDLSGKVNRSELDDYASKIFVDNKIGAIDTALDSIIAVQNSLIGGVSV